MADGTYEYECMRAELLGAGKPDYEEFQQRKREADENRRLAAEAEEEAVMAADLEAAASQGEALHSAGGKLDELNSILSATQRRLDRFKVRCGSVTELIKTKIGTATIATGDNGESSPPPSRPDAEDIDAATRPTPDERRSQLSRAVDDHVDKLDSLLGKAERAELSLSNQNKRIRNLLK